MNPANYLIPMTDLYVQWLNRWKAVDGMNDTFRYDIHQFLDQKAYPYSSAEVLAVVPCAPGAFPRFMVIAVVSDGDEGGPVELTTWFEVHDDNTTDIVAMVQGFDTNYQFIYEDRHFINLPEEEE